MNILLPLWNQMELGVYFVKSGFVRNTMVWYQSRDPEGPWGPLWFQTIWIPTSSPKSARLSRVLKHRRAQRGTRHNLQNLFFFWPGFGCRTFVLNHFYERRIYDSVFSILSNLRGLKSVQKDVSAIRVRVTRDFFAFFEKNKSKMMFLCGK